jgi:hypothetical protein
MNRAKSMKRTQQPAGEYEIGYCKPPKHAQFTKGVSGNPGGRHKKPATMVDTLQDVLGESIEVLSGGKRTVITKMQAAVRRLVDKSIAGDMSAFRVLSVFVQALTDSPNVSGSELEELDKKVLENLFRRVARKE